MIDNIDKLKTLYDITGSILDINTLLINRNEYEELLKRLQEYELNCGEGKVYYEAYIEGCNESFNDMMQELNNVRSKLAESTS